VWIVDPIDGTSDFVRGGDEHACSIGHAVDGAAVLGVVHNPARGELYSGAVGAGAWLGEASVTVSSASELERARLTVSRTEWWQGLDRLATSLPLRPVASVAYKLARVAAGLDDGTFTSKPRREWDVCAGVALILAAGGRVALLDGGAPLRFNQREVQLASGLVAAGPALFPALTEKVRAALHGQLPSSLA
jgi:fructose-1,6-bisphosphatase/inositol monophosphatase family enzyme